MLPAHQLGKTGENQAIKYLRNEGYKIRSRNFRTKFGEIDIIAKDKDTLVFVEVKTRSGTGFGNPEESITPGKIGRIIKACEYYLLLNRLESSPYRIDVIAIENNRLEHYQNITL